MHKETQQGSCMSLYFFANLICAYKWHLSISSKGGLFFPSSSLIGSNSGVLVSFSLIPVNANPVLLNFTPRGKENWSEWGGLYPRHGSIHRKLIFRPYRMIKSISDIPVSLLSQVLGIWSQVSSPWRAMQNTVPSFSEIPCLRAWVYFLGWDSPYERNYSAA